ncbi:hypothetical protein JRO89_XS01G0121000 [Xanthoceras sorbifolium]|uniref:SAM domain-containing protein n=1 Tax=Xanthoceras sorbifolium TaxID=99658 RepID=A0ABQ8IIX9_9ROSI|nr:hypothetical protein JRO89_XS01G0121000 [Xanthoceras sorbifolium]
MNELRRRFSRSIDCTCPKLFELARNLGHSELVLDSEVVVSIPERCGFSDIPSEYLSFLFFKDVGLWLEEINLGGYRQIFKENGVNGEYLEGMSMFTTEQILRFIRRCHMKWGDFITLCKELRRIKGSLPLDLSVFCKNFVQKKIFFF